MVEAMMSPFELCWKRARAIYPSIVVGGNVLAWFGLVGLIQVREVAFVEG
jgi:hypothetical protein